jgi:hypothetical protein
MRHQLRPSIEPLETKSLLSSMAMGLIGNPLRGVPVVTGPIGPPVRVPIAAPVTGPIATPVSGRPVTLAPSSSLLISLTTNVASYTPGQVVTMTFTETNDTTQNVLVPLGPSIDGLAITSGSQTIWPSNSGMQSDLIYLDNLAPGQSITLTASWTATSVAGTYSVDNQLAPDVTASFDIVASQAIVVLPRLGR